jgi:hypothetical protein
MARPWRDIMSFEDFSTVLNSEPVLDKRGGLNDEGRSLMVVARMIKQYHTLEKRDRNLIAERQQHLARIAEAAEEWFEFSEQDKQKNKRGGLYVDETTLPLWRVMLTLTRRSLRKAVYLQQLSNYLAGAMETTQWIESIHSPREIGRGQLGLVVKMEKEDFVHRDGYEDNEGAMHIAFEEWCNGTGKNGFPFFLWLEGHAICTSSDKHSRTVKGPKSIEYVQPGGTPSTSSKMCLLGISKPPILAFSLTEDLILQNCDTYLMGYYGGREKHINPDNNFGKGIACYVWAPNDDVFIADHKSGKFHHSSFLSGGNVKCAGMIGIKSGLVTELSNDSGHYKPRLDEFYAFVRFLRARHVISDDCYLKVATGGNDGWRGLNSEFNPRMISQGGGLTPGKREGKRPG